MEQKMVVPLQMVSTQKIQILLMQILNIKMVGFTGVKLVIHQVVTNKERSTPLFNLANI
jgi:hypothetical protein